MNAAERGASFGALRSVETGRSEPSGSAPSVRIAEPFRVTVLCDGGYCVVRPVGELDLGTVDELEVALLDPFERGATEIVLDLRFLGFCDAAGLQVFLRVRRRAVAAGAVLRLQNPTRTVRRVLEISELGWLIDEAASSRCATA